MNDPLCNLYFSDWNVSEVSVDVPGKLYIRMLLATAEPPDARSDFRGCVTVTVLVAVAPTA